MQVWAERGQHRAEAMRQPPTNGYEDARAAMVASQLMGRGVTDQTVLRAMGRVPRERFVSPVYAAEAYEDRAVPLALGQTVSQPYMVAVMTEALGPLLARAQIGHWASTSTRWSGSASCRSARAPCSKTSATTRCTIAWATGRWGGRRPPRSTRSW